MSSYWSSDNVVHIAEEQISIPTENGLEYSVKQSGRKVQLTIPPEVKFMDGKNSYLEFDLKIDQPFGVPTRLQLDPHGAQVLFKNMRIYDGSRGVLLEELVEYQTWACLKYDYDADDSLRQKRALEEGGTCWNPTNRGTLGTSRSDMADTRTNPYFKAETLGEDLDVIYDADNLRTAKCCLPLHAGIFSDKIFPVMMTNGLYIEWDLAPAGEVVKQLDSVSRYRRTPLNPVFHSLGDNATTTWLTTNANAETSFLISSQNNLVGDDAVSKFPFVVGETVNFVKADDNTKVGRFTQDGDEIGKGGFIIDEIKLHASGKVEVVVNDPAGLINDGSEDDGAIDITQDFVLYSTAVSEASSYDIGYTISNVNLIVHKVDLDPAYEKGMMSKLREGKSIEFDFMSWTNYKHSSLASDKQTSFNFHVNNSRAKSLVIQSQDATIYPNQVLITGGSETLAQETYKITENSMDKKLNSVRSAYSGICDGLTSVQYQIDGKLVPSRPISTRKCATKNSIDQFHLYELEKTLSQADIPPRSFKCFLENWNVGRGFGVHGGAMDLRNKDLTCIFKYEDATHVPEKNKMYQAFVYHIRRLVIRNGGVEIIV
jgi:hypothetical protein